jgi:CrcB protein
MTKWLFVAGGGALGSVLRYALQGWVQRATGVLFPVGTLVANVLGCLIIGVLAAALAGPVLIREEYRIGLMVGILGGFTTFSSFGLETFNLANDRQFGLAAANVVVSCTLGLAAVWIGYRLAERWLGV